MKTIENKQKGASEAVNEVAAEMLKSCLVALQFTGTADIIGRIRMCEGGIVFADSRVEQASVIELKKDGCK